MDFCLFVCVSHFFIPQFNGLMFGKCLPLCPVQLMIQRYTKTAALNVHISNRLCILTIQTHDTFYPNDYKQHNAKADSHSRAAHKNHFIFH